MAAPSVSPSSVLLSDAAPLEPLAAQLEDLRATMTAETGPAKAGETKAAAGAGSGADEESGNMKAMAILELVDRKLVSVVAALLVALVLISVLVYVLLSRVEDSAVEDVFQRHALSRLRDLQCEIDSSALLLTGLSALVQLNPNISRDQFRHYVERIDNNTKTIGEKDASRELTYSGTAWAPFLRHSARAKYEAQAAADLADTANVRRYFHCGGCASSSDQPGRNPDVDVYTPVYYIEPVSGNENAVNFNLYSQATRRATIDKARVTRRPVITSRITLVQEARKSYASLVMMPVFALDVRDTVEEDGFLGIVDIVVRIERVLKKTMSAYKDEQVTVVLVEKVDGAESLVLGTYRNGDENFEYKEPLSEEEVNGLSSTLEFHSDIVYFDKTWRMSIYGTASDYHGSARASEVLLGVLLAASVILTVMASYTMFRHNESLRMRDTHVSRLQLEADTLDTEKRAMERFVRTTSHDLRTPMQAVQTAGQLLRRSDSDESEEGKLITAIQASCTLMDGILSNTLDSANIQSKQVEVTLKACSNLDEQFRWVITAAQLALNPSVSCIVQIEEMPALVCDSRMLTCIIQNLTTNAMKFTRSGVIRIHASVDEQQQGSMGTGELMLFLSVTDQGVGIPPDILQELGKPYLRSATRDGGGTGLGIYITKSFVASMGGTIRIKSVEGKGTSISCVIPVKRWVPDANGEVDDKSANISTDLGSANVLIVDDNHLLRSMLSQLCKRSGHSVRICGSGQEALSLITSDAGRDLDVVFMDVDMPGTLDGNQCTACVRQWERARETKLPLHIVVTSGNVMAEDRNMVLAAGASEFLPKPASAEAISANIRLALGLKHAAGLR